MYSRTNSTYQPYTGGRDREQIAKEMRMARPERPRQRAPGPLHPPGPGPVSYPHLEPPPSQPPSSSGPSPHPLLPKDHTECRCRVSYLVKAALFLLLLLAGTGGLVAWFVGSGGVVEVGEAGLRGVGDNVIEEFRIAEEPMSEERIGKILNAVEEVELEVSPLEGVVEVEEELVLNPKVVIDLIEEDDVLEEDIEENIYNLEVTVEEERNVDQITNIYVGEFDKENNLKDVVVNYDKKRKDEVITANPENDLVEDIIEDKIEIQISDESRMNNDDVKLDNVPSTEHLNGDSDIVVEEVKEISENVESDETDTNTENTEDTVNTKVEVKKLFSDVPTTPSDILFTQQPTINPSSNTLDVIMDYDGKEEEAIEIKEENVADNDITKQFDILKSVTEDPDYSAIKTFTVTQEKILVTPTSEPLVSVKLSTEPSGDSKTVASPIVKHSHFKATIQPELFVTETVFGFLDFVTTVGNTVMVFTPADPAAESSAHLTHDLLTPHLLPLQAVESTAALGLERLFSNLERTDKPDQLVRTVSGDWEVDPSSIQPTPSVKEEPHEDKDGWELVDSLNGEGVLNTRLVSETSRTLVDSGQTTVFTTQVIGEVDPVSGGYVQSFRTFSEVLGGPEDLDGGFSGVVEQTQLPDFAVLADQGASTEKEKRFDDDNTIVRESVSEARKSANLSFKERLQQRFRKFRAEHSQVLSQKPEVRETNFGRSLRERNQEKEEVEVKDSKRGSERGNPQFGKRTDQIRKKLSEVLSISKHKTLEKTFDLQRTFVPSALKTYSRERDIKATSSTRQVIPELATRTPPVFQRVNKFNRPDIRKNLLDRVLGQRTEKTDIEKENRVEQAKEEQSEDHTEEDKYIEEATEETVTEIDSDYDIVLTEKTPDNIPLILLSGKNEEDHIFHPIDPLENISHMESPDQDLERLQSTLNIETQFLGPSHSLHYEVVTVKSPYSFSVEEGSKSTRFITVTRTLTSSSPSQSYSTVLPDVSQSIKFDSFGTPGLQFIDVDQELDTGESINRETFLSVQLPLEENKKPGASFPVIQSSFVEQSPTPSQEFRPYILAPETGLFQTPALEPYLTPALEPYQTPLVLSYQTLESQPQLTSDLQPYQTSNLQPYQTADLKPSPLPVEILSNLGLNQDQLNYIQVLQQGLSNLQPQVLTLSEPVLRTSTSYLTTTIRLVQNNKEFSTTLLLPAGVTTVTEGFSLLTTTLAPIPQLPPVPPNLPPIPVPLLTTVISSPVIQTTLVTELETQEYKIRFRNRPIVTTLINTKVFSTVITSFVTTTQTLPSHNNLLAGFLG